jgi:predicted transcriptional regulator
MPVAPPGLTLADQRRLEKLARDAGRTSRVMFRFVLRDGFGVTERLVGAVQAGRAEVRTGKLCSHAQLMNEIDALLADHAA